MRERITWVGMDVHASSITLAWFDGAGRTPETREIANEPKLLRRTLTRLAVGGGELRCCYEAGSCGFEVWRQLQEARIACEVVAPALIPRKAGERIKTDRRDAIQLARLYRAGELTMIRVPTPEEEAVRDLVRAREDVRQDLIAAKHRLSKFLLRHGRIYSAGCPWTDRHWRWLNGQSFTHPAAEATFRHYVDQVQQLDQTRRDLERQIAELAETPPYREPVRRISCLRGISVLGGTSLIAEIQDFRRFARPRQLMGFLGVVPSERSSGGREHRGGITKTGNSHARRLLIEAAWTYRHPPKLTARQQRLLADQPPETTALVKRAMNRLHRRYVRLVSRGKKPQVAITAVARELCGFLWALMVQPAA